MSVLYFYADPRSTYNYIVDDEERLKAIIEQEGLPEDFKITEDLDNALQEYKKHTITTSYLLLQDTKIAVDKVRQFLREVNLNETDDKGKPLYTINSITQAIKQIPQLSKDLLEAEKIVSKEIEEQGRARGGNNKTLFEDGISF
jgi:vacuolar-type H+-ATPase subunit I/STV1